MDLSLKLCLTGSGSSVRVAPEIIKARGDVLQKYLDHQPESELQALYALQALVHKLEHPQGVLLMSYVFIWKKIWIDELEDHRFWFFCFTGVLRTIFDTLYDEDIISEEGLNNWEKSKDPNEQEGKGVAMKQVVQFFTWLRQDDEEGSDN